jgi:uncharacterized integral membrane protein
MWHRFLRQLAFWAGFATCALIVAVIYFNPATVTLNFWRWELTEVNLGLVAVAPLVIGVALGYLYHLPARLHHVSEHMRHRRRVHELEKELKDLRKGMDQVLEMPADELRASATPALEARPLPALEAPKNGDTDDAAVALDAAVVLPEEPSAPVKKARGSNGKPSRKARKPALAAELVAATPVELPAS